ncbi:MAG: hypothetical protein KGZ25_01085, partial [Planctomycetes bacterium]|nr:hypothetical protein [Planctomycetota bacterium]
MSKRYLKLVLRWTRVGMKWFDCWDGRPNCGHFFGGVLWYGQETAMPMVTLATAASSSEYDPQVIGMSGGEMRQICRQCLRYLCFTHDTGPADCVRPEESWGRTEPAGTKWGERGRGFFPESQCGRTIAHLAITALLLPEILGDEERTMLQSIAEDYMQRVNGWQPRSGVFFNTQTEENAWTAVGIAACIALHPNHPDVDQWREQLKLWAFRTVTRPEDAHDHSVFDDSRTISELCGHTFTTLPDGTAENHGVVHPNYMASAIGLAGWAITTLRLADEEVPPHLLRGRRETYELLKNWADNTGTFHAPQGMDWPFLKFHNDIFNHTVANLLWDDPEAALLERQAVEVVERASRAHNGRIVPEEVTEYCHGQQDPAIMRERSVAAIAAASLMHRLMGEGADPVSLDEMQQQRAGVQIYRQGGILLHRHQTGINSLSWRNCSMVLPSPSGGIKHVGPASGSMLARIEVDDHAWNVRRVKLCIRESVDRGSALLVQDLAEGSVRRQLYFASLPDGRCVTLERLRALKDITVNRLSQGCLCIMNDPYFSDSPGETALTVSWDGGQRTLRGYAGGEDAAAERIDLN